MEERDMAGLWVGEIWRNRDCGMARLAEKMNELDIRYPIPLSSMAQII